MPYKYLRALETFTQRRKSKYEVVMYEEMYTRTPFYNTGFMCFTCIKSLKFGGYTLGSQY
jgi:hypothetical protein